MTANDYARAMSDEDMKRRAAEQADGMRNAWPHSIDHARAQNALLGSFEVIAGPPRPTLRQRLRAFFRPKDRA